MSDLIEQFNKILPANRQITETEKRAIQEAKDSIQVYGTLVQVNRFGEPVLDDAGKMVPAHYRTIPGRRFLLDKHGVLWRYFPKGSPKIRHKPDQEVIRRFNGVEMWTGKWRRVLHPQTGEPTYAKRTQIVAIDKHINARSENFCHIDWYRTQKGYKHPFDPPEAPLERDVNAMNRQRAATSEVVYAKMQELAKKEGMDIDKLQAADPAIQAAQAAVPKTPKKRKKRTNKPKNDTGS